MPFRQVLTLEIRTGPPPGRLDAADTGTLLGRAELPSPDSGSGAGNARHLTLVARVVATGTAGHFRLKSHQGCVDQGTIGRFGDGADIVIDRVDLRIDEQIAVAPRFGRG